MRNKWKLAFFILLGVVFVLFITLYIMVNTPVKDGIENRIKGRQLLETNEVALDVRANKRDLNKIINHYLEEEGFTGPFDYEVILKDEVELYGSFPVFDQNIEMMLTFEPIALENGDLVMKQNSISIGTLNLPVAYVLKIIQNNYSLPDWVQIQPDDESVYVSLQEMPLKSNIKVRANSFDLKNDEISFTLQVPVE